MTTKVGVTSLIGYIHRLPLVTIVVTSGYVVATSDILVVIDNGNNNVMMSAVSSIPPRPQVPIPCQEYFSISVLGKSRIQTVNSFFFSFLYKRKTIRLKLDLSAESI